MVLPDVLVGQVSTSVDEAKDSSLVPGQLTASTLKSVTENENELKYYKIRHEKTGNLQLLPGRGVVLSKSYGLVASSPKSSTIISLLRLMAWSRSVSTDLLESSLFFRPHDSKFSLPYVQTACVKIVMRILRVCLPVMFYIPVHTGPGST